MNKTLKKLFLSTLCAGMIFSTATPVFASEHKSVKIRPGSTLEYIKADEVECNDDFFDNANIVPYPTQGNRITVYGQYNHDYDVDLFKFQALNSGNMRFAINKHYSVPRGLGIIVEYIIYDTTTNELVEDFDLVLDECIGYTSYIRNMKAGHEYSLDIVFHGDRDILDNYIGQPFYSFSINNTAK